MADACRSGIITAGSWSLFAVVVPEGRFAPAISHLNRGEFGVLMYPFFFFLLCLWVFFSFFYCLVINFVFKRAEFRGLVYFILFSIVCPCLFFFFYVVISQLKKRNQIFFVFCCCCCCWRCVHCRFFFFNVFNYVAFPMLLLLNAFYAG